jgi:hypothetical protein
MKQIRLGDLASAALAETEVQGEIEAQIKNLVHRDSIFTRKPRLPLIHSCSDRDANRVVERISEISLEMIDQAISQLQSMKARLLDQNEQVWVQIRALKVVNEEASGSLKTVSHILAQWKQNSPLESPLVAAE